ncbi:MAG: GAF domain-containing protein [FCB group bacterium]|nr:GAF domain-containing protein [FCB group bacterium]
MPQFYYDMLFCSMFIVVLITLIKIRGRFSVVDREAVGRIISGLWFLTGFSFIQLLGHQNLMAGIPYLEETAGRQILEAFAIVSGLMFMLIGIGSLMPSMARSRKERRELNRRYFCLKMISQTIDRETDLDKAFERVMNCLTTYLGMVRCAAFKYRSRQEMMHLSSTAGFVEKSPRRLARLNLHGTNIKSALHTFRASRDWQDDQLLGDAEQPQLVLPVSRHGHLYGAMFCWVDSRITLDDDLIDFATTVGEMLGERANLQVERTKRDYYESQRTAHRQISDLCQTASSVRDVMTDLYRILMGLTGAEFLSLAVLDNSGENMIVNTIGSGGRLLLERGVSRPTRGGDISRINQTGEICLKPVVDPDHDQDEEDGLFLSCGMRSKLACPVKLGRKIIAVATLGHISPGYFTHFHQNRISDIISPVSDVIQRERLNHIVEVKEDHMLRLQLLERELSTDTPLQAIFDNACDLLAKRMKCTMARISLIDRNEKNLISQSCRTVRNTGHKLRETAEIPLSLLPWHNMALSERKLMLINQEDSQSQMQLQESTSVLLPDICSAMLVPITLDNKVRGIISLGESRNWKRRSFAATDLIFAKDVAAKCSVAMRTSKLKLDIERIREQTARLTVSNPDQWREVKARMSSPLTSIIGAVELIQRKGASDKSTEKYHNLILKSADRIKTLTESYGSGVIEENDRQPEMIPG